MDLSSIPKPALVVAGLTGLAAIAGGTFAMMQPSSQSPVIASPTPTLSTTIASKTTEKTGNKTAIAKTNVEQSEKAAAPELEKPAAEKPVESGKEPSKEPGKEPDHDPGAGRTATRTIERCETSMAKIDDPNPPANVRSAPEATTPETVVGTLRNGTFVTIVDDQKDWFKISTPLKGWVAKRITQSGCNQKVERIQFGRGQSGLVLEDQFIGTGSHDYILRFTKGQTLQLTAQNGPLPTLVTPSGKILTPLRDNLPTWSGTLPATGEYKVIFESNFKGYKYATALDVN